MKETQEKTAKGDSTGAHWKGRQDALLRVANLTRNTQIAVNLEVAASGPKRSKGLLGRTGLGAGGGLWIIPCEAVHTFFMKFPIDLIYLDRKLRVKKIRHGVPAWRISGCLSAHSVLELPVGTIRDSRTERGDTLEIVERA
jgi:uncharacterized membrane protein (UPF0127 family)